MKKKKKVIIGVVTVVVVAAAAVAGFVIKNRMGGSVSTSGKSEESVFVDSVDTIIHPTAGGTIDRFSGVVEPQKTWKIEAKSEKTIKEFFVKEGDQVKTGQDLFIYDTSEAEENLVEAEIELDRLTSDIETTRAQIETMNKEKAKVTGENEILEYTNLIQTKENSLKKSEYDLKKQQVTIEQLKSSIANATVQSEMDGIVKNINEDANQSSSAYGYGGDEESNALMTILATGNYRVKGTVNEQNKMAIQEGLPVIVHSRVDENETWAGTMGSLDTENTVQNNSDYYGGMNSSGENNSSNYNFYVDLESSDGLILGQHVYIEMDYGQYAHADGIWLNSYYIVQEEGTDPYVWAADSRDRMEKRTVTFGEYDEELDQYEITDGLTEEDYIAFPIEGIEEGMAAERNVENATFGTGADNASGLEGEILDGMENLGDEEYLGNEEGLGDEEYLGEEEELGDGFEGEEELGNGDGLSGDEDLGDDYDLGGDEEELGANGNEGGDGVQPGNGMEGEEQ